jgi:predicted ATP-grasp superfamily ATP-dependent carboligase
LVYGSGFERATGLLAALARGRPLWGNGPEAIRAVKDPASFAAAAQQLNIRHPEIRFRPPEDPQGWLCKRSGGAGGGHVHRAGTRPPRGHGWYWQHRAQGRPVSALVIGNGSAARLLGCSEQWAAPLPGRRFRFAGTLAPATLSPVAGAGLAAAAVALVQHHGMVGLVSVDALVAGDTVTVLELNPRPGASLDAYAQALGLDLFGLHRAACAGRLPSAPSAGDRAAGSLIVYARRTVTVAADFVWPAWCADLSPSGTRIAAGGPIATVLAEGRDPLAVRALLAARACDLLGQIDRPVRLAAPRRSSVG